jgi:hypothetical protein
VTPSKATCRRSSLVRSQQGRPAAGGARDERRTTFDIMHIIGAVVRADAGRCRAGESQPRT